MICQTHDCIKFHIVFSDTVSKELPNFGNLGIGGEPSIILCILFCGGMGAFLVYLGYACSKWTLFVTETRVVGHFGRTEVDLPVNKITHIAKSGDKRITITTPSGIINCTYCTNRDEVFSVITRLIDNQK